MRSNINVNSSLKLFEVYNNFIGGLNTQTSNDNLANNESTIFENFDLLSGGSMHKRTGYEKMSYGATVFETQDATGNPCQGIFKFKHSDGKISIIVASSGRLYAMGTSLMGVTGITDISAASGGWTFQSSNPIDAVQYQDAMYLATGSKLGKLTFSGSFSVVDVAETILNAYQATYVGYNLYNSTANFLSQWANTTATGAFKVSLVSLGIGYTPQPTLGTAMTLPVTGTSTNRKPAAGDRVTFIAFYNIDSSSTSGLQYQWDIKRGTDQNFTTIKTYSTDNFLDYQFDGFDNYDIRVTLKATTGTMSGKTTSAVLTPFTVLPSPDQNTLATGTLKAEINKCRRCLIHFNRLFLYYGDLESNPTTPNRIFVSEFNDFGYFPLFSYIDVVSDASQPITNITRIRNELVVFTPSSIYTITGDDQENTAVYQINDQFGTWHGWSPTVVGNNILFAGNDNIYSLQPNQYLLNNYNVVPIGTKILNKYRELGGTVTRFPRFYGCYYNNQYYLGARPQLAYPVDGNEVNILKYSPATKAWGFDTLNPTNPYIPDVQFAGITGMFVNGDTLYTVNSMLGYIGASYSAANLLTSYSATEDNTAVSNYYDMYDQKIVSTIETKFFDLSAAYNFKKLKRLYILMKHFDTETDLYVTITADANVALTPDTSAPTYTTLPSGQIVWQVTTTSEANVKDISSMLLGTGSLDQSILGEFPVSSYKVSVRAKARRIGLKFVHEGISPMEVYGFGLEFREKRP